MDFSDIWQPPLVTHLLVKEFIIENIAFGRVPSPHTLSTNKNFHTAYVTQKRVPSLKISGHLSNIYRSYGVKSASKLARYRNK